jgi:hypothetical protein
MTVIAYEPENTTPPEDKPDAAASIDARVSALEIDAFEAHCRDALVRRDRTNQSIGFACGIIWTIVVLWSVRR